MLTRQSETADFYKPPPISLPPAFRLVLLPAFRSSSSLSVGDRKSILLPPISETSPRIRRTVLWSPERRGDRHETATSDHGHPGDVHADDGGGPLALLQGRGSHARRVRRGTLAPWDSSQDDAENVMLRRGLLAPQRLHDGVFDGRLGSGGSEHLFRRGMRAGKTLPPRRDPIAQFLCSSIHSSRTGPVSFPQKSRLQTFERDGRVQGP